MLEITIREFLESDAESLAKHANNKKIAAYGHDNFPSPYKIENATRFIKACIEKSNPLRIDRAIVIDNNAVGAISLAFNDQEEVYKKTAEIGYWIGEAFWGMGIMPKVIMHICYTAFANYDIERIYAETFEINTRSTKCLKKAHFTYEATLRNSICKYGMVQNSCIYSILRNEALPTDLKKIEL